MNNLKKRDTGKDLYIIPDAVPKDVVEYLKNIYFLYPWRREPSFVTNTQNKNGEASDIRKSEYIRITKDEADFQDIFNNLEDKIFQLNNLHYNFDIAGIVEDIKIIRYGVGDYFDWHYDMMGVHVSDRKLNFSIQLSETTDYEGGDLEFFLFDTKPNKEMRDAGTFICYPSFLPHCANKVTKGERFVLVGHVSGNTFR